jgi:hypothetical protein
VKDLLNAEDGLERSEKRRSGGRRLKQPDSGDLRARRIRQHRDNQDVLKGKCLENGVLPVGLQQLRLLSANGVITGACTCARAFHSLLLPTMLHAVHLPLGRSCLRGCAVTARARDLQLARHLTG